MLVFVSRIEGDGTVNYTVGFFGHRIIYDINEIEDRLEDSVIKLLKENDHVDFLVGRNGDFDRIVSSTVKRIKKDLGLSNYSLILVLPYDSAEYRYNAESFEDYYDKIEICEKSNKSYFKSAIQTRNKAIVDRCDIIICYIEHDNSGAYQTVRYAIKKEKRIINLAKNRLF